MLKLTNVSKTYDEIRGPVLEGIDLEIEQGSRLGLMGPSGVGKSTLLRILAGKEDADRGQVQRNSETKVYFQNYLDFCDIFHKTVLEILEEGACEIKDEDERHRHLHGLIDFFQIQYEQDRTLDTLSEGQRRRAWLASMLATNANLLILDEPFSGLDMATRDEMVPLLNRSLELTGASLYLVSHSLEDFEDLEVGEVSFLEDGRFYDQGTLKDLYFRPNHIQVARALGRVNLLFGEVKNGHHVSEFGEFPVIHIPDGTRGFLVMRPEQVCQHHDLGVPFSKTFQMEKSWFHGSRGNLSLLKNGPDSLWLRSVDHSLPPKMKKIELLAIPPFHFIPA